MIASNKFNWNRKIRQNCSLSACKTHSFSTLFLLFILLDSLDLYDQVLHHVVGCFFGALPALIFSIKNTQHAASTAHTTTDISNNLLPKREAGR